MVNSELGFHIFETHNFYQIWNKTLKTTFALCQCIMALHSY